jgi:hypothetical protein
MPRKSTAVVPYLVPEPEDVASHVADDEDDDALDPTVEAQLAQAETWQKAWELHMSGVSFRAIGRTLDVHAGTAMRYVRRHQAKLGHSPRWEDERERQLAVLSDLEHKLYREAAGKDGTSWVAVSNQIRAVHSDMRLLMGYADPKVQAPTGPAGVDVESPGVGSALDATRTLRLAVGQ